MKGRKKEIEALLRSEYNIVEAKSFRNDSLLEL